jgi:alkanesulfonate monooxygenase SsuD/methylene tetrahydromethanopterin reductase-like flavin-dependent oxidoreductase (luciferase family)
MLFGVHLRPTDETIDIRDLAQRVEAAGFESLWVSEHSHMPVATASQWPGGEGMPRFMSRFLDPFLSLARAAAVTERIRLGTGIVLLPQRDTIQVAREASTLDFQSGGRLLLGVGAGWNREEMRNHGLDPAVRFRKMREQVLALKAIWTEDEAAYRGELIGFDPIQMWPKPLQRPHPSTRVPGHPLGPAGAGQALPVLIGGEGPTVLDRVLDYGDGWIPNDHSELPERAAELHRRAGALGRDLPPVTAFAVRAEAERIAVLEAAGVERCVFNLPDGDASAVLSRLDRLREVCGL